MKIKEGIKILENQAEYRMSLRKEGRKKVLDNLKKWTDEYKKYINGKPCETCIKNFKRIIKKLREEKE